MRIGTRKRADQGESFPVTVITQAIHGRQANGLRQRPIFETSSAALGATSRNSRSESQCKTSSARSSDDPSRPPTATATKRTWLRNKVCCHEPGAGNEPPNPHHPCHRTCALRLIVAIDTGGCLWERPLPVCDEWTWPRRARPWPPVLSFFPATATRTAETSPPSLPFSFARGPARGLLTDEAPRFLGAS